MSTNTNNNQKQSGISLSNNKQLNIQQQPTHHHVQVQQKQSIQQTILNQQSNLVSAQQQLNQHQQIISQQQNQLQSGQIIPPRYQPPPNPSGGILKHGGTNNLVQQTKSGIPTFFPSPPSAGTANLTDPTNAPHINLKYPPEVPKLTPVYIPDTIRNGSNQSRIVPPRITNHLQQPHQISGVPNHQLQQQTGHIIPQSQPNHRIISEDNKLLRLQNTGLTAVNQQHEMLKFVRKPNETDQPGISAAQTIPVQSVKTITNGGRLSIEQNRQLQSLVAELRTLKDANQRLSDDNQELRDLCCFLDDDRQKGRKLAREWQRFGRYTASVMRQEVSAYQNKLRQLDDKQQELIRDNLELKELCLYLDEERANVASTTAVCTNCGATVQPNVLRDEGDGSSSSTNADEPMPSELNIRPTLSDQTLQYVRSLERRVRQLEEEQTSGGSNIGQNSQPNGTVDQQLIGRPEAVVRALQILEVREQLERDRNGNTSISPEHMDDGEKALVREMCNVVWRKLEDSPNDPGIDPL